MAGVTFTLKPKDLKVLEKLGQIEGRMRNLAPAMKVSAQIIRDSAIKNFAAGGRPPWLKSKKKKGKTLIKTTRLMKSIHPASGPNWAAAGTNTVYAAIHQFGGTIQRKPRQQVVHFKTFKRGKNKGKTLFSKEKKATHGMKLNISGYKMVIPARPFLLLAEQEKGEIRAVIKKYVVLKG